MLCPLLPLIMPVGLRAVAAGAHRAPTPVAALAVVKEQPTACRIGACRTRQAAGRPAGPPPTRAPAPAARRPRLRRADIPSAGPHPLPCGCLGQCNIQRCQIAAGAPGRRCSEAAVYRLAQLDRRIEHGAGTGRTGAAAPAGRRSAVLAQRSRSSGLSSSSVGVALPRQ